MPLLVTASVEEARAEAAAGRDVVLIAPRGSRVGESSPGPGRIHRFVGDPADPAVSQAAAEMATELGAVEKRG